MAKPKKLTIRQEAFCQKTAQTLNPTQAVKETYNLGGKGGSKTIERMENTASSIAVENLLKPNIANRLTELMEVKGITRGRLIDVMNEILNDQENASARTKIVDMAWKLFNAYPDSFVRVQKVEDTVADLFK